MKLFLLLVLSICLYGHLCDARRGGRGGRTKDRKTRIITRFMKRISWLCNSFQKLERMQEQMQAHSPDSHAEKRKINLIGIDEATKILNPSMMELLDNICTIFDDLTDLTLSNVGGPAGGGQGGGPMNGAGGQGGGPMNGAGGQGSGLMNGAGGQGSGPMNGAGGQGSGPMNGAGGQGSGPMNGAGGQGSGPVKLRAVGGQSGGASMVGGIRDMNTLIRHIVMRISRLCRIGKRLKSLQMDVGEDQPSTVKQKMELIIEDPEFQDSLKEMCDAFQNPPTEPPVPGVPVTTEPPVPGVPVTTVPPIPGVPVTTEPITVPQATDGPVTVPGAFPARHF